MPKSRPRKSKDPLGGAEIAYVDIVLDDPARTTFRVDYKRDKVYFIKQHTLDLVPSVGGPIRLADFTEVCKKVLEKRAQGMTQPGVHPDSAAHEREE